MQVDELLLRYAHVTRPQREHPGLLDRFGVRSMGQVRHDVAAVVREGLQRKRFQVGLSSAGLLRPDLSLPAYAGLVPADGRAPIYNLFDRVGGGQHYSNRVTRAHARDFRGGHLSYDEHDGTDFVVPVGTHLCAAAPGTVVLVHDNWLRGGLTVGVDHGHGLMTQYTHCARVLWQVGDCISRGEPVAISGAAGLDIAQFFPLVPPHVHFMVWYRGRPVDPYRAEHEGPRPGQWLHGNLPRPAEPKGQDLVMAPSPVDAQRLQHALDCCFDDDLRAELEAARGHDAVLAARVEDALQHDAWAFTSEARDLCVRPAETDASRAQALAIGLTLPLPADRYTGARCGDNRFTAPQPNA